MERNSAHYNGNFRKKKRGKKYGRPTPRVHMGSPSHEHRVLRFSTHPFSFLFFSGAPHCKQASKQCIWRIKPRAPAARSAKLTSAELRFIACRLDRLTGRWPRSWQQLPWAVAAQTGRCPCRVVQLAVPTARPSGLRSGQPRKVKHPLRTS